MASSVPHANSVPSGLKTDTHESAAQSVRSGTEQPFSESRNARRLRPFQARLAPGREREAVSVGVETPTRAVRKLAFRRLEYEQYVASDQVPDGQMPVIAQCGQAPAVSREPDLPSGTPNY